MCKSQIDLGCLRMDLLSTDMILIRIDQKNANRVLEDGCHIESIQKSKNRSIDHRALHIGICICDLASVTSVAVLGKEIHLDHVRRQAYLDLPSDVKCQEVVKPLTRSEDFCEKRGVYHLQNAFILSISCLALQFIDKLTP